MKLKNKAFFRFNIFSIIILLCLGAWLYFSLNITVSANDSNPSLEPKENYFINDFFSETDFPSKKNIKSVILLFDGFKGNFWTYDEKVEDFLKNNNITIFEHDKVYPNPETRLEDGIVISVKRSISLDLEIAGEMTKKNTTSRTVRNFLLSEGIVLNELDEVYPPLDTVLLNNSTVIVTKIDKNQVQHDILYPSENNEYKFLIKSYKEIVVNGVAVGKEEESLAEPRFDDLDVLKNLNEGSSSFYNKNEFVQYIAQFMGIPYLWGGITTAGFDCSGFVQYVYRYGYDIQLPRTAAQMEQIGDTVINLEQGDLIFFSEDKARVSHVGIYIGDGEFISATSSKGISVSKIYSPYWLDRCVGAKRINKQNA